MRQTIFIQIQKNRQNVLTKAIPRLYICPRSGTVNFPNHPYPRHLKKQTGSKQTSLPEKIHITIRLQVSQRFASACHSVSCRTTHSHIAILLRQPISLFQVLRARSIPKIIPMNSPKNKKTKNEKGRCENKTNDCTGKIATQVKQSLDETRKIVKRWIDERQKNKLSISRLRGIEHELTDLIRVLSHFVCQ